MATSNSRPWICTRSHHEEHCPANRRRSCQQTHHRSGGELSGGKARLLKIPGGVGLRVGGRKKGAAAAAAQCGCRRDDSGGNWYRYRRTTEEQRGFVDDIREAQPYIHAHRGRTFIVVLSGEIVAGPCLDSILKVSSHLPPLSKATSSKTISNG